MSPAGKLQLLHCLMNIPIIDEKRGLDENGEPYETGEFFSLLTKEEALDLLGFKE